MASTDSATTDIIDLDSRAGRQACDRLRTTFAALREQVERVIAGQTYVVDAVLYALFLSGHVLLEGLPGLGKTVLVRSLARCLGLQFSRIQFTPDLMPADVIGTRVLEQQADGRMTFKFERGPLFANLVLADEINRATPKTQSAMLEAMQERQVTVAGTSYPLPDPFLVLATQNPLELEGTYPLPEAQLDRFMFKVNVGFPDQLTLVEIMRRTTGCGEPEERIEQVVDSAAVMASWRPLVRQVKAETALLDYGARLIMATHPNGEDAGTARQYVRFGAGPRALQSMILAAKLRALLDGRTTVKRDDLREVAPECLQHRLILNFEAQSRGVTVGDVIEEVLRQVRW